MCYAKSKAIIEIISVAMFSTTFTPSGSIGNPKPLFARRLSLVAMAAAPAPRGLDMPRRIGGADVAGESDGEDLGKAGWQAGGNGRNSRPCRSHLECTPVPKSAPWMTSNASGPVPMQWGFPGFPSGIIFIPTRSTNAWIPTAKPWPRWRC